MKVAIFLCYGISLLLFSRVDSVSLQGLADLKELRKSMSPPDANGTSVGNGTFLKNVNQMVIRLHKTPLFNYKLTNSIKVGVIPIAVTEKGAKVTGLMKETTVSGFYGLNITEFTIRKKKIAEGRFGDLEECLIEVYVRNLTVVGNCEYSGNWNGTEVKKNGLCSASYSDISAEIRIDVEKLVKKMNINPNDVIILEKWTPNDAGSVGIERAINMKIPPQLELFAEKKFLAKIKSLVPMFPMMKKMFHRGF